MSKPKFISENLSLVGNGRLLVDVGEVLNLGELKVKPVNPKIKDSNAGSDIALWGEDNNFPQQVIEMAELSTEIPTMLDWKARLLIGKGVVAMERYFDTDKKKYLYRDIQDDDIDIFLTDTTTKRYFYEAATDFVWFANIFPELIKSKDGNTIAYLGTQDASFCRWSKMDEKGKVKYCYVNANFPDAKVEDKETTKIDVIDPYDFEKVESVRKGKDRYIYPVSSPSPGKIYYQLAHWNGFITSTWAEISRMVPKSKTAMMKQVLSAKYILQIPFSYWPTAYKDWAKLPFEEQQSIKKAKVKEINDKLTGPEADGRTILTEVGYDQQTGKEIPGWKIIPVEKAVQGGENLEDSREASQHLMRSLDLDPTLVGDSPGKNMGSGSGSDKRVAFNAKVALLNPHRELLLEPLYFIAEYNGWKKKYPRLEFKFIEVELETLDKGKTSKEVIN